VAESLGRAVFDIDLNLAGFRQGLGQVLQQAKQAGTGIQSALSANKGTLAALDIRINSLKEEIRLVEIGSQKYKELAAEIRKATSERTKADAAQGGGIGASLGQGLGGLAAAAGIGVSFAGVATAIKSAVDAAVELESITKKLENTLGPSGAAGALNFTRQLSDQLGLSFKTLADGFGTFTAAASAAGVPLQQQKDLFAAVAKAGQALGLSNDALNGSFQALQQIASKGTVSMEELRGQLGERLPIALTAAANGLQINQRELIGLVESGKLTASEFFPALTKGLNELTKGAGGLETSAQQFQKLQNAWEELQVAFGQTVLPDVINLVKQLTEALKGVKIVADANKLGLGGGLLGNLFGSIPEQGVEAVVALQNLQQEFNLTAKQARALFTDAVKLEGIGNIAFASPKEFEAVLARLPGLAEEFRKKYKDVTGELQAANAAAGQQLEQERGLRQAILNQQSASLNTDLASLKTSEQRLGFYAQEYNLVGQIEKVRSDAALNRSNTVKSLLDQELQQAQALAGSDEERARLQQAYGKAKLDQTITEFKIKGDGLRSELASQEASLEFERQKSAAAAQRAVVEAQIEQIKAQQKALTGGPEAQKELELANQLVGIAQDAYSQELRLGGLRSQLFQEQKAAAAERLSNERLVALNALEAYGTDQQRAQIQADVNRQLQNTVQYSDAASVAAGQFKQELQGASQARGDLATAFQAQVNTTIDGSQQFSQMNSYLSTIATNTAKPPTVNVTVNNSGGGCGGNSSASVKASGRS
jgi:tape measure domain-containing protein